MIHQHIDVAYAVEETFQLYPELTFSDLEERVCAHPQVNKLVWEWGKDRLHDMLCYVLGFKRDEQTKKYVPGSRDSHLKDCVLKFLHFLNWSYEEGKLYYQHGPASN